MNEESDFLKQLASYGADLRRLIETECSGFATGVKSRQTRVNRAGKDYKYFCGTYFPHYVPTQEFSVFHKEIFKILPGLIKSKKKQRRIFIAPRGEAKSTYCTQLGTLYAVLFNHKKMIAILMDTVDQAYEMLEAIKAELDTNPRLISDFPQETGIGRVWQASTIVTNNNTKIRIGGTGKKIRGMKHGPHRPDLVILDDIENDENIMQKTQRDKTERWVDNAVTKLGPPDGSMSIVYVGTVLHHDAVINRTLKKPGWRSSKFSAIIKWPYRMDLWEKWEDRLRENEPLARSFYERNKREMQLGSVVSWPGVRPLYELMTIRAESHGSFDQEYQNTPNKSNEQVSGLKFYSKLPAGGTYFGAVDPALGKISGDYSAALVGYHCENKLYVVEAVVAKIHPDQLINTIIELQKKHVCAAWAFETVQFQEYLKGALVEKSMSACVPVPVVPVRPKKDKDTRILMTMPFINGGQILFSREHSLLNSQVLHWPQANHDDGPDALEMLWNIAVNSQMTIGYENLEND